MFSASSQARLALVYPELKSRALQLDSLIPDVNLQISAGLRTLAQEAAIYAEGRTTPGPIVSNSPAELSAHVYGYAIDVFPEDAQGNADWNVNHPNWQKILAAAPSCGLAEGAKWVTIHDNPHLYLQELPATPDQELIDALKTGGLTSVFALIATRLG